jgi:uncharacterized protein with ParB-like and HNH nuclease domain
MVDYDKNDLEFEDEPEEDEVLIKYDIATYPSDFTLSGIYDMWKNEDIKIPEFQREFVWSIKQSSSLIESFLLGLPVPPVFFHIDDNNNNVIIDGQQRILSIVYYFDGYFGSETLHGKRTVFRLKGLNEKSPYYEKKFSDLSESDQRKLSNSVVLRAINVRQLKPEKDRTSIYHIFERLNTGGTPLKPQEVRNCVFRGPIVNLLRELNKEDNWRKIIGKKLLDRHQRDVELVLRMFSLSYRFDKYEKPMKEFLNLSMNSHKDADSDEFKDFIIKFPEVCRIIVEKLGNKPFHLRGPMNTSTLDSVFCVILKNFGKLPKDLLTRFESLKLNNDFIEYTTMGTTDPKTVRNRFDLVEEILIG